MNFGEVESFSFFKCSDPFKLMSDCHHATVHIQETTSLTFFLQLLFIYFLISFFFWHIHDNFWITCSFQLHQDRVKLILGAHAPISTCVLVLSWNISVWCSLLLTICLSRIYPDMRAKVSQNAFCINGWR